MTSFNSVAETQAQLSRRLRISGDHARWPVALNLLDQAIDVLPRRDARERKAVWITRKHIQGAATDRPSRAEHDHALN